MPSRGSCRSDQGDQGTDQTAETRLVPLRRSLGQRLAKISGVDTDPAKPFPRVDFQRTCDLCPSECLAARDEKRSGRRSSLSDPSRLAHDRGAPAAAFAATSWMTAVLQTEVKKNRTPLVLSRPIIPNRTADVPRMLRTTNSAGVDPFPMRQRLDWTSDKLLY